MPPAPRLTPLLLAGLLLTSPLAAQTLIQATDTDAIVNIARGYGSATLETDSVGDPLIRGRIDGIIYVVNFYGCTNGADCTTIQFRGSWTNPGNVTADMMNDWNRDVRFGKAYLDEDGGPNIEWDVNLFGGVTPANLDDTFDWWKLILTKFAEEGM